MRKFFSIACIVILLVPCFAYAKEKEGNIEIAFSPNQGATKAILALISEAEKNIRIAAYSFTAKDIAAALLEAHKRGVDVQVVLDKSNVKSSYSSATFLKNQGIPVRINYRYAIMHSKYLIVDGRHVQTGSYNYSNAASTKNAENIVILKDMPEIVGRYQHNWQALWDESRPYEGAERH